MTLASKNKVNNHPIRITLQLKSKPLSSACSRLRSAETTFALGSIVKYFQGDAEIYDYKRGILEKVHTRHHDFRDLALETLMQNTVN